MNFLQMSLVAAVLVLVIVVVRSLTIHKLPKKTFLVLWGVALFRLLIPFYIPLPIYGFEVANRVIEVFANGTTPLTNPRVGLVPESVPNIEGNTWLYGVMPEHETQAPPQVPISPVMVVWVVGIIVLALFFIITHLRSRKKYMSGLPIESNDYINEWVQSLRLKRTIQVRYSDRINTPMTYGIWKPVILFPKTTDWQDETQLRYILTHELTHIRRFDVLTKWLLAVALCIHWFNPLVWVMYILANRDIELACDETVVRSYGEESKSAYVSALIGLEERKGGFTPLYNNFAKNAIKERIEAIMKLRKRSIFGIIAAVLMVTVMATATVMAAVPPRQGDFEVGDIISQPMETDSRFFGSFEELIAARGGRVPENAVGLEAWATRASQQAVAINTDLFEGLEVGDIVAIPVEGEPRMINSAEELAALLESRSLDIQFPIPFCGGNWFIVESNLTRYIEIISILTHPITGAFQGFLVGCAGYSSWLTRFCSVCPPDSIFVNWASCGARWTVS